MPLLIVLEQGREWGWTSTSAWVAYTVSAVAAVLFILQERRIGDEAILPLRMFRNRTVGVSSAASVVIGVAMFGGLAALPLYLQIVKGSTPTEAVPDAYQTFTFEFSSLYRTAGSAPLDLTNAQPKLILRKNDQAGRARFDFDEIVAVSGGPDPYELVPVTLWPPPDGDDTRAIWLYSGTKFDTAALEAL